MNVNNWVNMEVEFILTYINVMTVANFEYKIWTLIGRVISITLNKSMQVLINTLWGMHVWVDW